MPIPSPRRIEAAMSAAMQALADTPGDQAWTKIAEETDLFAVLDRLGECVLADMALAEAASERSRRLKERAERAKEVLRVAMEALEQKQVERPLFTASLVNVPGKVHIGDADAIPHDYLRPDLTEIGRALRQGETIPGATLGNGYATLRLTRV